VIIEKETDIRAMINAIKTNKTLVLFVDHTNFIKGLREDVIVRPTNAPSLGYISAIIQAEIHCPSQAERNAPNHATDSYPQV
jgi:tRNA uridine 5-carbamoylmethylation protein Kti12